MAFETVSHVSADDIRRAAQIVTDQGVSSNTAAVVGTNGGVYAFVGVAQWFELDPLEPDIKEDLRIKQTEESEVNDSDSWSI